MKPTILKPLVPQEEQEALWQKIAAFPLDDPDALFPFSRKLARENNWNYDFSLNAIEEYRKFIFLCCISPHGASPSKTIDQVWHLHLIYTYNYWEIFCRKTLGCDLHHHPATGGIQQQEKHGQWRRDTLELYRITFKADPPPAIWHDEDHRPPSPDKRLKRFLFPTFRYTPWLLLVLLAGCGGFSPIGITVAVFAFILFAVSRAAALSCGENPESGIKKKEQEDGGSSCGGSSCGGGSGCGGGCGGCGGCGG